jgi:quinohemoprotein ethanol dehydrogenase
LFLASIVALDADTGAYAWHYQMIPSDNWDFDVTQPLILTNLRINGSRRKVILQAPKHGFFYVIDRVIGKLISAKKFVAMNSFASEIDMVTGRPVVLPGAKYETSERSVTPDMHGAHNWQPMSYSPELGLVYFSARQSTSSYAVDRSYKPVQFDSNVGALTALVKESNSYLLAWDPVLQREVWRVPDGDGGTLATSGNLVIQGTARQSLAIYRATDGARLWEMATQASPLAGPITYMVDGAQYVAVSAGGSSAPGENSARRSVARILAFRVGGNSKLPDLPSVREPLIPASAPAAGPEAINRGASVYQRVCARCHGSHAISGSGVPDLRKMSSQTRAQFMDIVLKGARSERGMGSFADIVSEADAQEIEAYLLARAREP